MKLKLADWLCVHWDAQQIADVIAQLLTFPRQSYGGYLNPEVFVLEFPEDSDDLRFGELHIQKKADSYAEGFEPVVARDDDTDDIFIVGLMLYRLLAGRVADLSAAQFLLINAHGDQRVPLLRVPDSSYSELVKEMTDLNPDTRITREGVLDRLAALWPGTAVMRIVEEDTLTELERIQLPLTRGITLWQPAAHMYYEELIFQPKDSRALSIPYRMYAMEYICPVAAQHFPMPSVTGLHLQQWEPCFALDLGHSNIRIARLIPGKKPEAMPELPSVMAFQSQKLPVFGKDAVSLSANGRAELIECLTVSGGDLPAPRTVIAADGSSIQLTPQRIAKLMMEHLVRNFQELGYESNSPAVMTISAGQTPAVRSLWRNAAHDAGFHAELVSSPAAVLLYERLYENITGNVMIVDAGSGSVDICIIPCGNGLKPSEIAELTSLWTHTFSVPGGSTITETLMSNILQTINLQHGLSLYRQQDSGLSQAQFTANLHRIYNAAERIKRSLSFSEQAEERCELYDQTGATLKLRFRFTRQQLLTLTEPISRKIRQAMQQACADRNITPDLLSAVLLTGSSSICPSLRQTVNSFLQSPESRKIYLDHAGSVIRGAAFLTALRETSEDDDGITLTELPYDLGTITADPVRALPLFRTVLRAGTPMPSGKARCKYECELSENDLDENGNIRLRLYSRPRGLEHIQSTLEPEGSRIKILGFVKMPLPENFKLGEDHLVLHLTITSDEAVTAIADHLTRKNNLFSIFSNKKTPLTVIARSLPAEFHPLA